MQERNPQKGLKLLMEFMGTFILSSALSLSTFYSKTDSKYTQQGQPILVFMAFFAAITITRPISGGHINPAVTVAVYISEPAEKRQRNTVLYFFYILCQIAGAITACVFSYFFYNGNVLKFEITEGNKISSGFIIETIATFFFTYLILCQGNEDAQLTSDETISTLLITIALFGGCGIAGNITGGCLNPAIGIGHSLVRMIGESNKDEANLMWLFTLAPLSGGIIAGLVYLYFFKAYFDEKKGKSSNSGNNTDMLNKLI